MEKPGWMEHQQLRALVLEFLKTKPKGQFNDVANGVVALAIQKGLQGSRHGPGPVYGGPEPISELQPHALQEILQESVRQLLWEFLVQGVLVFGNSWHDGNWPWYTLTEHGVEAASSERPTPHDPDGFLAHFGSVNPNANDTIVEYLTEAVQTFNHDCLKSSAVMLGAASEMSMLLLHETFYGAIGDDGEKKAFARDSGWQISARYRTLQDRLERMLTKDKAFRDYRDAIQRYLPPVFELIRVQRNAAGHPELVGEIKRDELFISFGMFSEYVRQIYRLIDFFSSNPASW